MLVEGEGGEGSGGSPVSSSMSTTSTTTSTQSTKDELGGKNLVCLRLVPLLPRHDNLKRGGGGNVTEAAVVASSTLKKDLLGKATLAVESFVAPAPAEMASSSLSTSRS